MSHDADPTRRSLLRGLIGLGGATLAAGALGACKPDDTGEPDVVDDDDITWDETVDIVIVGAGGAGLTAAVEALEALGSEGTVVLLEKSGAAGGSTAVSGGVIQAAGTSWQSDHGITGDDTSHHYEYYMQTAEGTADADLVATLTDRAPEALTWLADHGLSYVSVYGVSEIPTVDDAHMIDRIHVPGGGGGDVAAPGTGAVHTAALQAAAEDLGADLRTQAPVTSLVWSDEDGVVGVIADIDGTPTAIRASRAVILASGGFDRNTELARAFSPQQLWELETGVCYCAPDNTGDGMLMGMDLGADLAGMGGTIGVPAVSMGSAPLNAAMAAVPGIWVNRYGQRFVNEATHYAYAMRAVFQQEGHDAWAIFDDDVAALGGEVLGGLWGSWSEDLSDEIASGLVVTAPTVAALADALGINAVQLQRTMDEYNADMAGGTDPVFGKDMGLAPLDTGPFYAVKVTSVNLGSCGGLRIDTNTRVIDVHGDPIPGLLAAGMVAGGFIGPYYPGSGTAILSTVVFGRIAGAQAANRAPRA